MKIPVSPDELRLDKTAFTVGDLGDEGPDLDYWLGATPEERLRYMSSSAGSTMDIEPTRDFSEFLASLNPSGVEYLVIGGYAVAYHGFPRATNHLDVWIRVSPENAERPVRALTGFSFDVPGLNRSAAQGASRRQRTMPIRNSPFSVSTDCTPVDGSPAPQVTTLYRPRVGASGGRCPGEGSSAAREAAREPQASPRAPLTGPCAGAIGSGGSRCDGTCRIAASVTLAGGPFAANLKVSQP